MVGVPPPRILVTRAAKQASTLADTLRALGAEPILVPTIEFAEPTSFAPLDTALDNLSQFDWLIFTSANAAHALGTRLAARFPDLPIGEIPPPPHYDFLDTPGEIALPSQSAFRAIFCGLPTIGDGLRHMLSQQKLPFKVASIGPATGRALNLLSIYPNLSAKQAIAESLTEALLPLARKEDGTPTRFLLVRAEEARDYLPEKLREAGADLTIAPAYRTVTPPAALDALRELFSDPAMQPQAITFTSSSTARNLFTLFELANIDLHSRLISIAWYDSPEHGRYDEITMSKRPAMASIGPITSATIRDFKYSVDVEASEAKVETLARELMNYLNGPNARYHRHEL